MSGSQAPRPTVVQLRGHHANVWDLRPLEQLRHRFDIRVAVTGSNLHEVASLELPQIRLRTPRDLLPSGRVSGAVAYAIGERYLDLARHLRGADLVHAAEIGSWHAAQAAALKRRLGYRLVVTVWETLPWGAALRWPRERMYRRQVLAAGDLFLAATNRARRCLLLEGVDPERIEVVPPGIELARFRDPRDASGSGQGHVVLSAGRLVWEKGHHDAIRAVAAIRRGYLGSRRDDVRLLIVGSGPERDRLRRHAEDLGVADAVEIRETVPYAEMPGLYGRASALVLASLPTRGWEEQFGMVLAEAMAAGLPIVAYATGAIPEVLGGEGTLVDAGDWWGLASALIHGPLSGTPGERRSPNEELLETYSAPAQAARLERAYMRVLDRE